MKKLLVLATAALSVVAHAERWDSMKNNNPNFFAPVAGGKINLELKALKTEAKLEDDRLGWSDSFWPSNKGGIAYRWNSSNPQPFKYKSPTKEELVSLQRNNPAALEALMNELSPAELYDISQGDYKYSLTKKVLNTYSPKDLWWEGICHGWSLAASHYPEPDKNVVVNKDGIAVPFGASDVKGLMAMHDSFNSKGFYVRIGDRCAVPGKVPGEAFPEDGDVPMPSKKDADRPECRDVNAGAFHAVLANMIGEYSQGFVADVDRFNDVWNQPITGYESVIHNDYYPVTPQEYKSGIDRKVRVTTKMFYGDELEFRTHELELEGIIAFVSKEPVTGTPMQVTSERNYEYVLELDTFGKIVGGEWISDSRPDMLWMKKKDAKFIDGRFPLAGLNTIYKPVPKR